MQKTIIIFWFMWPCRFRCAFVIADGKDQFPLVMVGGVLEANKRWDIGKEVINCISNVYPGTRPVRPKVGKL